MSTTPGGPVDRRRVVVVRHGKAESTAVRDSARRLTDRGHTDSRDAGWLVAAVLATRPAGRFVALVSSATRADETWREVAAVLPGDVGVEEQVLDALYDAGVDDVVELLRDLPADVGTALVVGHDPAMRGLVHTLAGTGDQQALDRLEQRGFPTASVATLSVPGDWAALGPDACRLESFDVGGS